MSTTIKPGAWTGWPPVEVTARLQESEAASPFPPGTRIVVVEVTIGGVTYARATPTLDDADYADEAAGMVLDEVIRDLFAFMATYYRRLIMDVRRDEVAALLREDG